MTADLPVSIGLFLLASVAIVVAAVNLTAAADVIAARMGLGRLWVGSLLLAGATSLPELATAIAAALAGLRHAGCGQYVRGQHAQHEQPCHSHRPFRRPSDLPDAGPSAEGGCDIRHCPHGSGYPLHSAQDGRYVDGREPGGRGYTHRIPCAVRRCAQVQPGHRGARGGGTGPLAAVGPGLCSQPARRPFLWPDRYWPSPPSASPT